MVLAFDGSGEPHGPLPVGSGGGPGAGGRAALAGAGWLSRSTPVASGTRSGRWADNQGTVRDLVDDAGTLVEHIAYSPFGQQAGSATPGNPAAVDFVFGYTGTYTDPVTGLATPRRPLVRPDQPAVAEPGPEGAHRGTESV